MLATIRMDLKMEKVNFYGQKMSFMKGNFFKIESKAMVFTIGLMAVFIRVNGLTFRWMVKGSLFGLIRVGMLEGIKMGRNMDLVCLLIRKGGSLMGCGLMGKKDLLRIH